MKAVVNKIIPFSNVDGPGNRIAIFLQGCNYDCLYCHNPETIEIYSENSKDIPSEISLMSIEDIILEIEEVSSFITGITVSGGECLLQWKFLERLFTEVKTKWPELTCFVDSNCSIPLWTDEKKEFLDSVDKIMIDIKAFDENDHTLLTGFKNEIVIENFKYLSKKDKIYEVRTVIVPEIINNEEMVNEISKLIFENNKNIKYKIIKYRQNGVREDILKSYTPNDKYMKLLREVAINNGVIDVIIV